MVKNMVKKHLLNKMKEQIKKLNAQGLYSVFTSKYFKEHFESEKSAFNMITLYNDAKKCDDLYPVLRGTGLKLEELANDSNRVLAIYENNSDGLQSDVIRRTLTSGIPIHHSQLSGETLAGEGKLRFTDNILELMNALKSTSNGKFVLSFPKDLVAKDGSWNGYDFCELFNTDDENIYVKPKYVDSYINFGNEGLNRRNAKSLEEILVQK